MRRVFSPCQCVCACRTRTFIKCSLLSALLLAQSSSPNIERPRGAPPCCWPKHKCCWDFLWACLTRGRIARRNGGTSPVPTGPSDYRRGMCPQTPWPQRVSAGVDSSSLWWCVVLRCAVWKEVCCCGKEVFSKLDAGQGAPFFGLV